MSYHPLLLSDLEANQQFKANLGSGGMGKNGIGSGSKIQHHTVFLHVGSKNGANSGSDASPPLQSFTEESSPENITGSTPPLGIGNGRAMRTCQSTESLDSLSDESGGHTHNKSSSSRKVKKRKCRALYDCQADNEDELTFAEDAIIIIINHETEDENWMEGYLINNPTKRGLFPVSFVNMID
jgi:Arf-GAP/SH3 domain/ANK repeat/PH domain-containing protein